MSTQDREMAEQLNATGLILSYASVGLAHTMEQGEEMFDAETVEAEMGGRRSLLVSSIRHWLRQVDACGGVGILHDEALITYCTYRDDEAVIDADSREHTPLHDTVAEEAGER